MKLINVSVYTTFDQTDTITVWVNVDHIIAVSHCMMKRGQDVKKVTVINLSKPIIFSYCDTSTLLVLEEVWYIVNSISDLNC